MCLDGAAFCAAGATVATSPTTSSTTWGAGVGVNLSQTQGSGTSPAMYTATGKSGIQYAVSGLPAAPLGLRLLIGNQGGTDYGATLTAMSGMVPWSAFSTTPWQPDAGTSLTGPPAAQHIEFQVVSASTAGTFNFCVTMLGFY